MIVSHSAAHFCFNVLVDWKLETGCFWWYSRNRHKTGQIVGVIARDLWMPHNVTLKHGGFIVLDSLRGRFLKDNFQEVGVFPGFTRGFHYDNRYSYIGQSKNRNFSKQLGVSKNISIDSGVIIFDDLTKVSELYNCHIQLQKYMAFIALASDQLASFPQAWNRSNVGEIDLYACFT